MYFNCERNLIIEDDINNGPYDNERFAYAKVIALAVAKQLDRMDETLRNRFVLLIIIQSFSFTFKTSNLYDY